MSTPISSLLSYRESALTCSSAATLAIGCSAISTSEKRTHFTGAVLSRNVSDATERLRGQVRSIGPHFRTALITGERGARKEEIARALHSASPVANGPFVVCDSGWMESLLRNAGKTGVKSAEERASLRNLARTAQGGTIFFPELGLFSTIAQRELLRFLNCSKDERGSHIRVIASVSGDVQAMVAGGTLLTELRERIGVIELAVAPLRERLADFRELAERILGQIAERAGVRAVMISEDALQELQRRGWPGNDRELESTLRMASLMSGGHTIERAHLPLATEQADTEERRCGQASSIKLQDVLDAHVQEVLRRCAGNKLKAAEVLGISRSTLYRMLDALSVAN